MIFIEGFIACIGLVLVGMFLVYVLAEWIFLPKTIKNGLEEIAEAIRNRRN